MLFWQIHTIWLITNSHLGRQLVCNDFALFYFALANRKMPFCNKEQYICKGKRVIKKNPHFESSYQSYEIVSFSVVYWSEKFIDL